MKTLTGEQVNPPEPSESIIDAIDRLRIEIESAKRELVRSVRVYDHWQQVSINTQVRGQEDMITLMRQLAEAAKK